MFKHSKVNGGIKVEDAQKLDYTKLDDKELVSLSKIDKNAVSELVLRYIFIIEYKAKAYGKTPDEVADLSQEGLVGFIKSVQTYDDSRGIMFSTYANTCITNKMLSFIAKMNKISFNEALSDDVEAFSGIGNDSNVPESPESIILEQEKYREIISRISYSLTDLEWTVFNLYLEEKTYLQIADELSLSQKAVDNAMQRVRKKLKSVINNENC